MTVDDSRKGYAICTDARSGSSLLSRALFSTGRLGDPREHFHDRAYVRALRRRNGLGEVLDCATTPNGVFGLKVFAPHFDVSRGLDWATLPGLRFVHLTRTDLLGQAISLARARQTSKFKSYQVSTAEPRFRGRAIAAALAEIAYGRARWDCFFARNGIEPLRLTYEAVVSAPQAAATAVAELIGLTGPVTVDLAKFDLAIQRDAVSDQWRARFLAERSNYGYFDAGWLTAITAVPTRFARLFLGG